ncbi:hypothetical protein [Lentiprolixibacter aurantiacus]|uniref:Lipocalin-like domain-containing protein n=1 Tax=Lentiprolixibacter aurantiacus TaxID=2993939 RepID=A0AAE3SM93_9FLAO|nr:hypothetical protein [Lentiprolixibacter aurantiacus]MCX2718036.1 hypothetical protein [Lentiprolixibacter aurantiacus]
MKALNTILFCLLTSVMVFAQQQEFTGTWNLIDFKMVMEENTNHMDKATLNKEGAVWDLIFREDGSMTQTSNMRNGETESWDGRYETEGDNLKLFLMIEGREMPLQYQFEFKDNVLHLKRSNPMGTVHILTQFRKS